VDDDPAVLKGLGRLFHSAGYETVLFNSAKAFMEHCPRDAAGCLVLDLSMPGVSGLELQRWLNQANNPLPVIFLTGHGDIPASVRAMKEGAVDFLTKPVPQARILKAIEEALQKQREARASHGETEALRARLATLTPREREVFELVVSGRLNKQIADELGTVEKTIKVHRARVMRKMGVQSLAELVRTSERLGVGVR
jgi:FixJ family two-component response regulator